MKKRLNALLLILLIQNIAFCAPNQSTNPFPVELKATDVPDPAPQSGGGGLSGGAVTAITLGSIGGVAILGAVAWLLKPYWCQGLKTGAAMGVDCPLMPICLDGDVVSNILAKNPCLAQLAKVFEVNPIVENTGAKYIMIPDTEISGNSFNTVVFEIPSDVKNAQGIINVKITQVSNPINNGDFEAKFYIKENTSGVQNGAQNKEIALNTTLSKENEGIVQKAGTINSADLNNEKTGALVVSYKNNSLSKEALPAQKYAYLIEFKG